MRADLSPQSARITVALSLNGREVRADAQRGENVAAAVVLEPGAALDPQELRARVKAMLAAYKVPRHVWVCERAALPFTDSGKIDKRRLRALLEERIAAGAL